MKQNKFLLLFTFVLFSITLTQGASVGDSGVVAPVGNFSNGINLEDELVSLTTPGSNNNIIRASSAETASLLNPDFTLSQRSDNKTLRWFSYDGSDFFNFLELRYSQNDVSMMTELDLGFNNISNVGNIDIEGANIEKINDEVYVEGSNSADIQNAIDQAETDGIKKVNVRKGTYQISNTIEMFDELSLNFEEGSILNITTNIDGILMKTSNILSGLNMETSVSGYNNDFIKSESSFSQDNRIFLRDIYLYNKDGIEGNGISIVVNQNGDRQGWGEMNTIEIKGFENGIYMEASAPDGTGWINSWKFNNIMGSLSKNFILINSTGDNDIDGNYFDIRFQTESQTERSLISLGGRNNYFLFYTWDLTEKSTTNISYELDSNSNNNLILGSWTGSEYVINNGTGNVFKSYNSVRENDFGSKINLTLEGEDSTNNDSPYLKLFGDLSGSQEVTGIQIFARGGYDWGRHDYVIKQHNSDDYTSSYDAFWIEPDGDTYVNGTLYTNEISTEDTVSNMYSGTEITENLETWYKIGSLSGGGASATILATGLDGFSSEDYAGNALASFKTGNGDDEFGGYFYTERQRSSNEPSIDFGWVKTATQEIDIYANFGAFTYGNLFVLNGYGFTENITEVSDPNMTSLDEIFPIHSNALFHDNVSIDGYTKLGSDAPAIKTKKLTTTLASAGNTVTVAHGLDRDDILDCSIMAVSTGGYRYHPVAVADESSIIYYWYRIDNTNINIETGASATAIEGRAAEILITYEE